MKKILFICHGNICRSPMAEYVFKYMVKNQRLEHLFEIDSAATSTEEIGNGVHHGTRTILAQKNIPCGNHRARQLTMADYNYYDLLIGMDRYNVQNITRMTGGDSQNKVEMLLDRPIADPWYTGDFQQTFQDVEEGCTKLLKRLLKQ